MGWVLGHDVPKLTRYSRELIADPLLRRLGSAYPACVAAGLLLFVILFFMLFRVVLHRTKAEFEAIARGIRNEMAEDVDKVHVDCAGGACPVDFVKA